MRGLQLADASDRGAVPAEAWDYLVVDGGQLMAGTTWSECMARLWFSTAGAAARRALMLRGLTLDDVDRLYRCVAHDATRNLDLGTVDQYRADTLALAERCAALARDLRHHDRGIALHHLPSEVTAPDGVAGHLRIPSEYLTHRALEHAAADLRAIAAAEDPIGIWLRQDLAHDRPKNAGTRSRAARFCAARLVRCIASTTWPKHVELRLPGEPSKRLIGRDPANQAVIDMLTAAFPLERPFRSDEVSKLRRR